MNIIKGFFVLILITNIFIVRSYLNDKNKENPDNNISVEQEHIHIYDEGKIIKKPTCTKEGLIEYNCTSCDNIYFEEIEKLSHNYQNGKCTICNNIDPSHTHTYDEGKVIKKPTCQEKGFKEYNCTSCDNIYLEEIEKLPHIFENYKCTVCNSIDPTHPHNYENDKCTICNELDPSVHIHKESTWTIVEKPTCTKEGKKQKTCTKCGEVIQTEVIEKVAHSYENGRCKVCKKKQKSE